jgi:hypothetical protein
MQLGEKGVQRGVARLLDFSDWEVFEYEISIFSAVLELCSVYYRWF